MPAEPPPDRVESNPPVVAEAAPARPVPRLDTEEALGAPTPLTVRLLAVICAATLLPWVGAKVACNRRESPVRPPLELATDVLAKQPKSAALELQQRAASNRYREAAELAKGAAAEELLAADTRCQSDPRPCEERRAQADRIQTRAVLLRRGPLVAEARAESWIGETVERYNMRLEADGGRWFVVSRTPFAGPLSEPLPVGAGGTAIQLTVQEGAASHGHAPPQPEPTPEPAPSAPH
jgi:hypothetical protein